MTALSDIDWASLEDAYGPALCVPDQLSSLAAGGPDWEHALGELYAGIFHQGGCYSATPVAVRFLIEMLSDEAAPKAAVLVFLAELSMAHVNDAAPGFDPWVFRSSPPSADYPEGAATVEAVQRGAGSYVKLLGHVLPEVRAAAAYLCAGVEATHALAAPLLITLLKTETEPTARASFALCHSRMGDATALSGLLTDPSWLVRGAAAVGCVWAGVSSPRVLKVLVEAASRTAEDLSPASQDFPWGQEGGIVTLAVAALARAGASRELRCVLDARLARGERPMEHVPWSPEAQATPPADELADELADEALRALATAIAPLAFPELLDRQRPALLSELTPDQRALIMQTAAVGLPLPILAVPWFTAQAMQRFLADTDGPLEREVRLASGERDVIWRQLYQVAPHTTPQAQVDEVLEAINADCDAQAVLALCMDMLSCAYNHFAGGGLCLPFEKWERLRSRLDAEAEVLEPALLVLASEPYGTDSRAAQLLARPLVALARRRGLALAASLDAVLRGALYSRDTAWVRALLESLPLQRRSTLVGGLGSAHTIRQYADLCDPALLQQGALRQLPA